jgi:hypothetical protein
MFALQNRRFVGFEYKDVKVFIGLQPKDTNYEVYNQWYTIRLTHTIRT